MAIFDNVPAAVRVVDVGPRDGLQNLATTYSTVAKERLIRALFVAGLRDVEVTSFVRPDRVPQLADADALLPRLEDLPGRAIALVANPRGLERAIAAGARAVSVVAAASDGFSRANVGRSASEGLAMAIELATAAKQSGRWVRGYVSTCFRCPYDGPVKSSRALSYLTALAAAPVDEIVVSDTLGDADPRQVASICDPLVRELGSARVALHLHDTYGLAMANLLVALEIGVQNVDGSIGGLGGCPFAPGARGNVATEQVVYLCDRLGVRTGIDRLKLTQALATLATET